MSAADPGPGEDDEAATQPGDIVGPVTVGPIAHGGHCVARYQGRVIFTRHTLPGEQVMITLTDTSQRSFWRGDATTILTGSPDRVEPACPISGPGGCGGCDFQHVTISAQRELKAAVLAEQLQRLAGLDRTVDVEAVPVPGDDLRADGLGWRTRMRYILDGHGGPGMRAHRSHRLIALPEQGCLIADPRIARPARDSTDLPTRDPAGPVTGAELIGVAAADGTHWLRGESELITERAIGRDWQVVADGFWQVHPAAADTLVAAVLAGLEPEPGEKAFDLYCGVGLFAGALIGAGCRVIGVESSRDAIQAARDNLADAGSRARFVAGRVDRALRQPRGSRSLPRSTDLVVLDPPRTGAGRSVVDQIALRRPRAIAYVACDPAALARDLGYFAKQGYRLGNLRAFDLFPMTHHLECVAILHPDH